MTIHSGNGKEVKSFNKKWQDKGRHSVQWDGRDDNGTRLPCGMYLLKTGVNTAALMKRMLVIK